MKPTVDELIERETRNGIAPPAYVVRSPTRILIWRDLAKGERLHAHDAARKFGGHMSETRRTLSAMHRAGVVHIAEWSHVKPRGPSAPVFAFGPGDDAKRPARQSNATVCRRWRRQNPELAAASEVRYREKLKIQQGRLPRGNDPLLFAIMGVAQ